MKKFLKIAGIICLAVLIWMVVIGGMLFLFSKQAKKNIDEMTRDMVVNTEGGKEVTGDNLEISVNITKDAFANQPNASDDYYDTMQEAINAKYASAENLYECTLQNIIKQFEIDDYILVCYNIKKTPRKETFIIAYFKVKVEEGKKKYTYICSETEERVYSKKKNIDLIELVHNEITGSKFRMVNSIKENVSFTCGIIDKKYLEEKQNVYNLKIEGKKPDEIIEFESFGEISYFWYYNDLQSDKPSSELEVTLKE